MKISKDDVRYIANLARLRFDEDEIERFASQLSKILDYMEKLNELHTEDIEPTSHVIPLKNVMRDDIERVSLSNEEVLLNAPDKKGNFFRVPRIIE